MNKFWLKVRPADPHECWEWIAGKFGRRGYGAFYDVARKNNRPAHVVAWELTCGAAPVGQNVLHKCDNRGCVNPDHLFIGTQTDNMRDKIYKQRHAGSYGPQKLGPADVLAIRASDERNLDIAARYGVSASLICNIRKGRAWKHLHA
jgi:methylaspartate ammonia-lyase